MQQTFKMFDTMLACLQGAAEFSLFGCFEAASVICIIYYIYRKTRAPAIISGLFPTLNWTASKVLSPSMLKQPKMEPKAQNLLDHAIGTRNMLELTPHGGRKPYQSVFDWGVYFPFIAQTVRSKKYDFPQVSKVVQRDPMLQRAIRQAAEQVLRDQRYEKRNLTGEPQTDGDDDYQKILGQQERRSVSILRDMRSTLNNFLIALTSWLLYKLLPCFLSGVVTHTQQIEMLKQASERSPGIPLIFLPLHRSHLDYVMVTFILANNDIRSPLVAAGNNLMIPVFGGLLRGLGAFFIKRKIDPVVGKKDVLYRATLQLYLQHALKMGHNVEFFIEGGRTRTGKPCMPKGGILSVIVNAYMDGSIPDALLVPVSLNYERLVDGNFVREQRGEAKTPESFGKAMHGIWKALNSKYGLMRIDFNEPYSLRELVQSYSKISKVVDEAGNRKAYAQAARTLQHNQSTSSLYGTDVVCEEHRHLIDSISRQVVYDCAVATTVMSTNALAFLFLTRYRRGASEKVLAAAMDNLRHKLNGHRDLGFSGESLHIVNYASNLLGAGMVQRTQSDGAEVLLQPGPTVESFIELAYYSNMLTPHFALQSIVLTTFHNLLAAATEKSTTAAATTTTPAWQPLVVGDTPAPPPRVGVSRQKLIEAALESCNIYRYEYILHKPSKTLQNEVDAVIDELLMQDLVCGPQMPEVSESALEGRRIARNLEIDGDDDEDEHDAERIGDCVTEAQVFPSATTLEEQRAICEVLAPFAHTYLTVTECLQQLLCPNAMLESEFVRLSTAEIAKKVQQGSCPYAESISTDSVRNCIKVLEKWSVVQIFNQRGLRLISLCKLYEMAPDSLKQIVQRLSAIVPNYQSGHF